MAVAKLTQSTSVLALLVSAMAFSAPDAALAQDNGDAESANVAAAGSSATGEIVVTAQKRSERLQDVPLSLQVVDPAQLEAAGVRQFSDLGKVSPSLVIRPAEHPQNAQITLRGVGTFAFSIGVEPSVAIQVDDAPLAFQARAFTDLPDVERVEVLRGPQSTLYGKNASAGLINFVTKDPTTSFTGTINAIGTTDEEYGVNFSVAGPISDTLGYRVSGSYSFFDGNVRNLVRGGEVNGREVFTTRVKLLWEPVDDLRVMLTGNYIDGRTDFGRPLIRLDPAANFRGNATLPASVYLSPGIEVGLGNQEVNNQRFTGTEYAGGGLTLKAEWEVADHTLVSITSWDKFKLDDFFDSDELNVAPTFDQNQIGTFDSEQWTQELRLLSPDDKVLRYTLGAFFADTQFKRPFVRGPVAGALNGYAIANWSATSGSRQYSAFGQLELEPIEGTTFIGGLRVQQEEVEYTFLDVAAGNQFFSGNADDTAVTYRLGVRQEFTDDLMAFVNYATGYKGQTYDLTTGFNANRAAAGPIRPETAGSLEIGVRTQFFDRRLTVNATYFDATYENLQAQTIEVLPDGTSNFRLTNVGEITTKGLELEASAALGDVNLSFAATYLDAIVNDFPVAQCFPGQTAAQGCVSPGPGQPTRQNLSGTRPSQTPKWRLAANFNWTPPLGSSGLRGVVQAAWNYQTDLNYSPNLDPELFQPGFHIVNLALGVRGEDRKFEVAAFVNNLFDQQYFAGFANRFGDFGNRRATAGILPRDFRRYGGIRASFNF
ncbi:TonB-dependent receptor [Sphingobium algorifonticola]|uniref:TonB-dependent receptor n=1 Tax=Sphingobium algorifonticola TaxID=2008318 RepID=A0A437J468_9SPHN|nr:TonB-dependent receptor [Sphingobium algorifonticola]RVT39415.1 TonB-dependent receptor [Sphingobium algorifonticola]